ncbi:HtaA domain-containing protein [Streptomyces sp. ISL-98]|uniref:HtaA domain-containing protein n=1 Tax=Streptomyces sp. ISL-98 TaxID=2819192 RepID=UPI001BEB7A91|nr:HtaA domain-containing protein [Streptomyces sp. ISL-98]MBT2511007.1 HtaA domain-containing protein [Streptomyces sp. ISL-98]
MAPTPRPTAIAAAVATAAALGATVLALPALAADGPPTKPMKIVGGSLDWGVKEGYRNYVKGMANGTITVADGAKSNADGTFNFGSATGEYDPVKHTVKAAFGGSVTFTSPPLPQGHGFEVKLSDLRFDTGAERLTADVTRDGGAVQEDVPLAEAKVAGPSMEKLATTLTKEAAAALGGPYEGKAGDPLTVKLEFEKPTTPPTGKPSEKPTAKPTTKPTTQPSEKPTAKPTAKPGSKPTSKPSGEPVAADSKIVDGNLDWGLYKRFVSYITGPIAHGKIELGGGAVKQGAGWRFPKGTGSFDGEKKTLDATFNGSIRFLGHKTAGKWALDTKFTNFRVQANGTKGKIVVDGVSNDRETQRPVTFKNRPLADLKLTAGSLKAKDGVVSLSGVPATLTAEGAKIFGAPYAAGDQLDKVAVAVSVTAGAGLPDGGADGGTGAGTGTTGGTSTTGGTVGGTGTTGTTTAGTVGGNLAATGSEVPADALLAASGTVVAAGAAVVFAARNRRTHA